MAAAVGNGQMKLSGAAFSEYQNSSHRPIFVTVQTPGTQSYNVQSVALWSRNAKVMYVE